MNREKQINRFIGLIIIFLIMQSACNYAPELKLDISKLENGTDSLRSFTIYNLGYKNLKIIDFISSCECTTLNLRKEYSIKPNDSLKIKLLIKSHEINQGKIIYITIKTNANPQLSSFHFKI